MLRCLGLGALPKFLQPELSCFMKSGCSYRHGVTYIAHQSAQYVGLPGYCMT